MTLTDFLLARIAEDEAAARVASETIGSGRWLAGKTQVGSEMMAVVADTYVPQHIARHDPARVLAECEAKRRIVETHRHADYSFGNSQSECPAMPRPLAESMILRDFAACDTLLLLAAVYADHPDYREEWKP